jgi:hypothetical protein
MNRERRKRDIGAGAFAVAEAAGASAVAGIEADKSGIKLRGGLF